jgi:CheY-like chemotaxis protein
MDISLPGMDGLTATRMLKQKESTAHIPVIALTAHAMKDDAPRAREAGCAAYLTKPVDSRTFYKTLAGFVKTANQEAVA